MKPVLRQFSHSDGEEKFLFNGKDRLRFHSTTSKGTVLTLYGYSDCVYRLSIKVNWVDTLGSFWRLHTTSWIAYSISLVIITFTQSLICLHNTGNFCINFVQGVIL
jgi:hypothetical protein